MRKVGFTLIELIVVVILIGVISFLVIKLPSTSTPLLTPMDLKNFKNLTLWVFEDGSNITDKNKTLNFHLITPVVYIYKKDGWEKKKFDDYLGKKVVFKYEIKNGIQKPFILECDSGVYVFKPLFIYRTNSLNKSERIYFNKNYAFKEGEVY